MDYNDLKKVVFETAIELVGKGPGWSQELVVLRDVRKKLSSTVPLDLPTEQTILRAWHDLFLDRKLSWGYNLDNPGAPFYHVPNGAFSSPAGP